MIQAWNLGLIPLCAKRACTSGICACKGKNLKRVSSISRDCYEFHTVRISNAVSGIVKTDMSNCEGVTILCSGWKGL